MVSALSYAIYIVGVNRPVLKSVATLKVTFYVLLSGCCFTLSGWTSAWQSMCPINGTCGGTCSHWLFPDGDLVLCTTSAIQYIGSTPTAILGALEPVTAVFFGVMIFGETLTLRICCGILLIIIAVSLIVAGNRVAAYVVRFRKLFPRLPLKRQAAKVPTALTARAGNNRNCLWGHAYPKMRAGIYPAKQKTDPTFAVSNPDGYERKREQCSDNRNPANGSRNAPRDTPSETAAEYVGPKAYSLILRICP